MQEPTKRRDGDGVILVLLLLVAAYLGWPRVVAWQSSAREARRVRPEATMARRPALEAPAEPASRDKRPKDAPDLATAIKDGKVEPRIEGDGISRIKVHLQPCGEEPPSPVVIPAGTYLQSPGGDVQNMMTIRTVVAELGVETEVPAVCCNADRAVPNPSSQFSVQSSPPQEDLRRLAAVIEERQPSQEAAQTAVWAVTDGLGVEELAETYQRVGPTGERSPAATPTHVQEARELLKAAGIDPGRRWLSETE